MKKLEKLAEEKGKPLDWIVLPLVNKLGVVGAAEELEIAPSTLSKWLKDNHYVSRTIVQKDTTEQEKADIQAAHDRVNAALVAEGRPTLEEEEDAS